MRDPGNQPPLPSLQRGEGHPVVLLHGMALAPSTYGSTIDRLAEHVRVIAPMWLYVEGTWSEEAVTEALRATIDAVDAGPVTVVGHSFGAALALLAAAAHPDRVGHLVVVNAMGASSPETMRRNALSPSAGRRLASLGAARDFLGSVATRPADVGRAGWWGYRREFDEEIDLLSRSAMRRDVLWAGGDRLLPVEDGRALAERLDAGFRIVDVRGRHLDHDWAYRHPRPFTAALLGLGIADR